MDVVPAADDPQKLFIYLVNHRIPEEDPTKTGWDSVIEIFETNVGSESLKHVKTFDDRTVLFKPNDVLGSADGKSFYFTNDNKDRKKSYENV